MSARPIKISPFLFFLAFWQISAAEIPAGLEEKLREALELRPDSVETNYNLGEYYLHTGKLLEGIPYMERAQAADPSNSVAGYDLALAYFKVRDYDKARDRIRTILGKQDSADLRSLLADAEEAAGDYIAAANEYQRAARMDPSEARIFDWGSEMLVHKNYQAAVRVFARGVELHAKSAKLNAGLGIARYLGGNAESAIKPLCSATDLDPTASWPYVFLGKINDVPPPYAEDVEKRLKRFADLQPNNPNALFYFAKSKWKRTQSAEANVTDVESLLKRAIALDPKFGDAYFQLGVLHSEQHNYPAAIEDFQRAIALQSNLTTAHYQLGRVYLRKGDKSQGEQELKMFESLRKQDQAEEDKERYQVNQFVITMKEQPPEGAK